MRPNVVIVTAIARDHWESMHTLENTRNEKADMLRILPRDGIAIVNADDENVRWMATQTRARVVFIGEAEDAEVRATDIELDWPIGMRFVAQVGGQSLPVATRLVGRHMIFPALAAITVAHIEGVPLDVADRRAREVDSDAGPDADDGAARAAPSLCATNSKDRRTRSWRRSQTLAEIPAQRRIGVIGEISEEHGRQAYRDVGAGAAGVLDRVVYVGSKKNMAAFRAGATKAGMAHECVEPRTHWPTTQQSCCAISWVRATSFS